MSKRSRPAAEESQPKITITVGGQLFLLDEVKVIIEPLSGEERYIPATCLGLNLDVHGYETDDVWSKDFLKGRTSSKSHQSS